MKHMLVKKRGCAWALKSATQNRFKFDGEGIRKASHQKNRDIL